MVGPVLRHLARIVFSLLHSLAQVGPYTNPSETYQYLSLPFCEPAEIQHDGHSLGEYLSGDRKVHTDYTANFGGALITSSR